MEIGHLYAGIAVFFWGAAYLWGKITMEWLSPLATTTARFGFAAVILLILIQFTAKPDRRCLRENGWHYFLLGFIGITCFQALLFLAINYTSPINVAVIMALSPVFTAITESIVSQQIPTARTISALIISVSGAVLAVLGANANSLSLLNLNWGDGLALLAALCFTFYTVASRRWMPINLTSLTNITIVITVGAILLLPFGLTALPDSLPSLTALWSLVGLVVGSTVVAYICWTRAIERIGITEPNLMFNFTPVVTMVLSSLYGAPPTILQIVGALLVIGGITWAMIKKR